VNCSNYAWAAFNAIASEQLPKAASHNALVSLIGDGNQKAPSPRRGFEKSQPVFEVI
jgi:hypothetical protein